MPNCPKRIETGRRVLKRCQPLESNVEGKPGTDHTYCKRFAEECIAGHDQDVVETEFDEVGDEERFGCDSCKDLHLEVRRLKLQVRKLTEKLEKMEHNLEKCFNKDQLEALKLRHGSTANQWSNETVMTALKIRCATGVKGYNFIRSLFLPLPSYRTLCSRVVNLELRPGIQKMILDWMETKLVGLHPHERSCSLLVDEVQISKAVEYDVSLKKFVGYVSQSFPTSDEVASHVLCFMAKGITTKWKQVLAYFYTGSSVDGGKLWAMTKEIIKELGVRGFMVNAVVSDMASSNQGMWRAAGITSGRDSVTCRVPHPFFAGRHLHFLADVPHLLKNLRSALLKHNIQLPIETVVKYCLPTPEVQSSHIAALVKFQEGKELKLAPKLTRAHIFPSHYQKMRVNLAAQVLSHSTASAVRVLVEQHVLPRAAVTTAFFCELFNQWFDIMNCRTSREALYENSQQKLAKLDEMLFVVQNMSFPNNIWKPVQSGIKLSITSLKSLHQDLVKSGDLKFLMSGRLTQDALENLFSQVRGFGNAHPKPTQFRAALKLIMLGQFMDVPTACNYDEDDAPHLLSFIRDHAPVLSDEPSTSTVSELDVLIGVASTSLDICEGSGLYYIAGWAIFKELHKVNCDTCKAAFTTSSVNCLQHPEALLTLVRSYNTATSNLNFDGEYTQHLCHPSANALEFFQNAEAVFRTNVELLSHHPRPEFELLQKIQLPAEYIPTCHNLLPKIMKRYLQLRLHIHAKAVSRAVIERQYASRSAARASVK